MSLLKQDTIKEGWVKENNAMELDAGDNSGKYEVRALCNSTVYMRKSELGHLLELYYLSFRKVCPEEKNTWELALAI